ncbi:hypothetical protein [Bradyrhizobium zhanjiangense]|uniref:hypothetical protein n=1 Tax=Bradyrhizobium zhanjiangense TaxID=1325107 RepID=UPI001FDFB9DA|nr:hypothetical protein [Bradyrhizobium zhanjiangense]
MNKLAGSVNLLPITSADVHAVAEFLHAHLNTRIASAEWEAAITPPWACAQPNHGFLLRAGERIVGVHLAFYSERRMEGRTERFCNLAAWCVIDEYRSIGLRLLNALLAQKGYHFTDLSPSGNVVPLNSRLKFFHLDVASALLPNLPWPIWSPRVRIISEPGEIGQILRGRDLDIYRDHAHAAAARHVVIVKDDVPCYVIFRRVRRKNLPLFASILYVSDRALFKRVAKYVFRHLLLRHGIPLTLAELRVVGVRPRPSIMLRSPRPKMYRSANLRPEQIDYLYSELTCVAW